MSRYYVIAIGVLAGAFSWAVLELIITAPSKADVTVIVAIIAASGTIATGVIGALITQAQSKDREILVQEKIQERQTQEAHRDKKVSRGPSASLQPLIQSVRVSKETHIASSS